MNILQLEASSGWGGQEMRILKEAEGMRLRGHTVFFGVMKGATLGKMASKEGFRVYALNFKKLHWIFCLFSLVRILFRHKIDVVNTHSSLDGWIGGIAAKLCRKKVVRTRHLSMPIKPGLNSTLLYGKLADFVVTTCAEIVPMIVRQSGNQKVRSVPTGIDPRKVIVEERESLDFREKLGIKEDDFLVGTACVMRSWKGINDLLEAANHLRAIPNLRFVIIGGGHAEIHHKKAKELKLEGIVQFTGHLENPYPAIGALDCFAILSTASEGVSQAILQAAYLKKPLISTPTGGLKEVCIPEETGILVPPFDSKAVASAILKLKDDPSLRERFGKNAHALAKSKFTIKRTLDEMEEIFHGRT